jgi:hypothetical protein
MFRRQVGATIEAFERGCLVGVSSGRVSSLGRRPRVSVLLSLLVCRAFADHDAADARLARVRSLSGSRGVPLGVLLLKVGIPFSF